MKKIKVAQVITRMDWGGSPDIVRILSQYLDKNRFEVFFICGPSAFPTEKTQVFFESLKSNLIKVNTLQRNVNPVFDFIAFWQLYFIFKKHKFDLVHTHTAKAGALGRLAAFFAGVKVIIHTSHGHNFYGYFSQLLSKIIILIERFLGSFTSEIITLTEMERSDLIKFKVCGQSKIKVINTVVEITEEYNDSEVNPITMKHNLMIEKEKIVIGMVGRLEPIKGVDLFIEAAMAIALRFPQTHFVVVGEGSMRNSLEQKIKVKELTHRFSFTGWQDNVLDYMLAMDMLVLASLNEAVGLVLIEAQIQGIPVIATKVGGIPEIVDDQKSGILINPSDRKALIEAIETLIKNPEQRLAMGQYAKKNVQTKYAVDLFIQRISLAYEDSIKRKL